MRYNNCDWFNYNDVSICNDVDDASFYKMWIDDENVDDWNVCEINSFSELSFIKIEMNGLTNWISSFTFISFINKNNLKDEDVILLIVKWWEIECWKAFTRLIKTKSKKTPFFFWHQMILKDFIMRSFDNNMR